jgi:hypothetical protein
MMKKRRKIIHDSSSSCSPPRGVVGQVSGPAALAVPSVSERLDAEREVKMIRQAVDGRAVIVISDDSEPGSPRSEQPDLAPVWNPLHFAAVNGHFPTADDVPMVGMPLAVVADDYDAGYLWNAVPPAVSQYLDLEAACIDDTSSGSSYRSDGELTPGFVDDLEPEESISADDMELLRRKFPHTFKCVCVVWHHRCCFDMPFRLMSSRRPGMLPAP